MKKDEIFEVVMTTVSEECGVSIEDILSSKRTEDLVDARIIAIYCFRKLNVPTCCVQKLFGRKNAYSINSLLSLYDNRKEQSFFFRQLATSSYNQVTSKLKENAL